MRRRAQRLHHRWHPRRRQSMRIRWLAHSAKALVLARAARKASADLVRAVVVGTASAVVEVQAVRAVVVQAVTDISPTNL